MFHQPLLLILILTMQVHNQLVYSIGNLDIYELLDPQSIQKCGNKNMDCHIEMDSRIQKEDLLRNFHIFIF